MSGYHPSLTAAVAAEHRTRLLREAELHRQHAKPGSSHHVHVKLVRPLWWTRILASVARVRVAHA